MTPQVRALLPEKKNHPEWCFKKPQCICGVEGWNIYREACIESLSKHEIAIVPSEEEIYKIMANVAEDACGQMSDIGEEITRNQAKAIRNLMLGREEGAG